MSQYNKISDIQHVQYAGFQILPVDLHFGLFWSAGIPTMPYGECRMICAPTMSKLQRLSKHFKKTHLLIVSILKQNMELKPLLEHRRY